MAWKRDYKSGVQTNRVRLFAKNGKHDTVLLMERNENKGKDKKLYK
jgi:hypothetical protein